MKIARSVAANATLWLLRVQGDYAYKSECERILERMYEYYS